MLARLPLTRGLLTSLLLLAACGENQVTDPSPTSSPADTQAFLSTLPTWKAYSPPLPDTNAPTGAPVEGDEVERIDDVGYVCTTTPYSLTQTPEKITTLNPDIEILWVGALLQGEGYVGGIGSLAELPIRQRSPITLTIDLLSQGNTEVVASPTVATVNQAIGGLISDAQSAGHMAGSNIFYTSETAYSLEQALLRMGASAKYAGSSIKASLSADISSEARTVTAYYVQRMFTVSMVLPQQPEEVFSDAFSEEMLEREIADGRMGPNNPPVYVSSITYGRIMMFSFTSSSSLAKIQATLSALYDGGSYGGGAELETELQQVLQEAKIQVVTVGGDAEQALGLIRSNDLGAFFTEDAPLTTARPISYTVRNLTDNAIAAVSETTSYDLKECSETPPTGARYKLTLKGIRALAVSDGLLEGPNTAELGYTVYVADDVNGPTVVAKFEQSIGNAYWKQFSVGDEFPFPGTNEVPVDVHFDGRDAVRIYGDLWDMDFAGGVNPIDSFPFDFVFRWPGIPLEGTTGWMVDDGQGNQFRLIWTVTKLEDLYD
jgi:hypothetical protein